MRYATPSRCPPPAPAPESAAAELSAHAKKHSVLPDRPRARALATARAHRAFIPVRSRGHNHLNSGHRQQEWEPPHVARDPLWAAIERKIVGSLPVRARIVRRRGVRSARSGHAPRASALHGQSAHTAALIAKVRPVRGPSTEPEPQADAAVLIVEAQPGRGPSTRREAPRALRGASKGHRGRRRVLRHAELARQIVSSSRVRARTVRSHDGRSARQGRNSAPRASALRGQSAHAVALIAEARPGRGPSIRHAAPRVLRGAEASL